MLVQAALQEANSGVGSDVSVPGRGMRRSVSATEMRKSNAIAQITARYGTGTAVVGPRQAGLSSSLRGPAPSLSVDARPHSAETGGGGIGWGPMQQAKSLKQSQASRRPTAAQVQAQLQIQFSRQQAVTTLQAHWRAWQHRRFARFLRARRKRHRRLGYLWELDYTNRLLVAHGAATFIQATWRASRGLATSQLLATSRALVTKEDPAGLAPVDRATEPSDPHATAEPEVPMAKSSTAAPRRGLVWKEDISEVRSDASVSFVYILLACQSHPITQPHPTPSTHTWHVEIHCQCVCVSMSLSASLCLCRCVSVSLRLRVSASLHLLCLRVSASLHLCVSVFVCVVSLSLCLNVSECLCVCASMRVRSVRRTVRVLVIVHALV